MDSEFDRIDDQIIGELQKDARLSNKELAARVGLAPSSCLRRVRKLEENGTIRGYSADVSPAVVGIGLEALVAVRLSQHSLEIFETFRASLLARAEVLGFYHLAGEDDFMVHVGVADAAHLRTLSWEAFTAHREVQSIRTSLLYEFSRNPIRRPQGQAEPSDTTPAPR